MRKWIWIGAAAGLLVILAGCKATRAGYESPKYVRNEKGRAIRDSGLSGYGGGFHTDGRC